MPYREDFESNRPSPRGSVDVDYPTPGPIMAPAYGIEKDNTPKLQQQLQRMEKSLSILGETIGMLEDHLGPITSPPDEMAANPNAPMSDSSESGLRASDLTNAVWDMANRVENQIHRLQRLNDRIEL